MPPSPNWVDAHSAEAEISVLGGMLVDPTVIGRVVELVDGAMFFEKPNALLFDAMVRLWKRQVGIEVVSLMDELQAAGAFDAVGGMPKISEIVDAVPTAVHVEQHARFVQGHARRRRIAAAVDSIHAGLQTGVDFQDVEEGIHELGRMAAEGEEGVETRPLPRSLASIIADPAALDPPKPLIPYLVWDERVTLLAAREKLGKSTLASAGAAAMSAGENFLSERGGRGRVLWLGLEEHVGDTAIRFQHFRADPKLIFILERVSNPLSDLSHAIREIQPAVVVIDTLAALVASLDLDPGSATAWTPIMGKLTAIARESRVGILVLHHGRKSDGTYRDSSAIAAGVDVVLTMTPGDERATRKVKGVARWAIEDCAVRLEGDSYRLAAGELSLDARVTLFVKDHPGCSLRLLRQGVSGKNADVQRAVQTLIAAGALEDQGDERGMSLHCAGEETGENRVENRSPASAGSGDRPRGTAAEPSPGTAREDERFPCTNTKGAGEPVAPDDPLWQALEVGDAA